MTSDQKSEARQTFFGCVYRNAQSSPAEIGRLYAHQVHDQKQLTTEVVKLMDSAFTVAMAESQDLRMQLDALKLSLTDANGMLAALEAEKYALEDQVRGLQELMAELQVGAVAEAYLYEGDYRTLQSYGRYRFSGIVVEEWKPYRKVHNRPDYVPNGGAVRNMTVTPLVRATTLPVADGKARDV